MNTNDLKIFTLEYINLQENLTFNDKIQLANFVKEGSKEQVLSLLFTGQMRSISLNEAKLVNTIYENCYLSEFSFGKLMADLNTAINNATQGIQTLKQAGSGVGAISTRHPAFSTPIGNSELLKGLAKKWAMFRVPSAKNLPGDLGVTAGTDADLIAFGTQYEKAIRSLNGGIPVAAGVVAAIIFIVARKAYKAYLTPAAKACKGTTGSDKTECIRAHKMNAMKETIKLMKSQIKTCKATSKPEKCAALVNKRIHSKEMQLKKMLMKKNPR